MWRVAIIGAGPIGVETAVAMEEAGYDVQVYEAGEEIGAAVRRWGHVRFFSPWALNMSARGVAWLEEAGRAVPEEGEYPTGGEYLEEYLRPLAEDRRLKGRVHRGSRVVSVGRRGVLKGEWIGSERRKECPFRLLIEGPEGERVEEAEIVIDASGTYGQPNRLGDGGMWAPGERRARALGLVEGYIPKVSGYELVGKHVAVVGDGYSAVTTLSELLGAGDKAPARITWVVRASGAPYVRIEGDTLPQRDELARFGNEVTRGSDARVKLMQEAAVEALEVDEPGASVTLRVRRGEEMERVEGLSKIFANVGYRPDVSLYRELQVHQCYASEGPMKLAAALLGADGGGGDCLAQTSMGAKTLTSPEPDFYVLGSKSYGRRSDFLLKLGLAQIDEVLSML